MFTCCLDDVVITCKHIADWCGLSFQINYGEKTCVLFSVLWFFMSASISSSQEEELLGSPTALELEQEISESQAVHQNLETTIDDIEEPDATKYINLLKDKIVIDQFPLKIKIIITSEFATPIAFDRIESHYSHPAKVVLTQNNLSKFYDDLIDKFKAWVDQFQERGSGFDFNSIKSVQDQTNKQTLYPIYVSNKESEKCYVVDLLYIENNGNAHYCLIKDLDSFMCDNNGHKQFTCRNCIQGFQREETLEKHKKICYDYEPCRTIMPEPGKNILEFNNHHFKNRLPFVIYCDFEACNIPMQSCTPDPDKSYTKPISKQEINSYGMYVHSDYPEIYKSQYFHYDGDDVDKPILNKYEEDEFQEATECYICGKEFEENNKVREHDHLSGKYRGAACQSCNTKRRKKKKVIGKFKDELNGKIMNEIVYLRSKAYSFTFVDLNQIKEEKKLKGIGKTTITKDIKFDDYKDCLFNNKTKMNKCIQMNSKKHEMFGNGVNKISTNPFDDKRYIKDNGIDTLPFGF
ncbi:unnamed protein product [Mytilus coruscus]|uniref:C2H2-type domain-containing protein n=1 Tax=Mytilus coruscus TaxID=42192 RepID=A0A6J8B0L3_MYTCO|nr:unnamed protein product [Mytilus coruscus]